MVTIDESPTCKRKGQNSYYTDPADVVKGLYVRSPPASKLLTDVIYKKYI